MLSVHTCPLATLGGKETGGMNVYVRELARELGNRGLAVDVFTRSQDERIKRVSTRLGNDVRVIHLPAGPERPYNKNEIYNYLPQFVDGIRALRVERGHHLRRDPQPLLALRPRRLRPARDVRCARSSICSTRLRS